MTSISYDRLGRLFFALVPKVLRYHIHDLLLRWLFMSPATLIAGQHLPIPILPQPATARSNALDTAVALLFVCLPLHCCPDFLHLMLSRLTLPPFIHCQTQQPMTFFAHILPLFPAYCAAFLFVPFLPHSSSFFIMPFLSASICRPTASVVKFDVDLYSIEPERIKLQENHSFDAFVFVSRLNM